MTDSIETAVTATATADVKTLETRVAALEARTVGYVRTHVVYFVGAICLIVGLVAGHVLR